MKKFTFILTTAILVILIGCSKHPDLGDGYRINTGDGSSLAIVNFESTVMIGTEILDYAFDSTFIIVSQRPWDSVPNIRTMNYTDSNKAFEKSTFRQYWIINKKERNVYYFDSVSNIARYSNVYGPFKKHEYLQKRVELKIPKVLELKEE